MICGAGAAVMEVMATDPAVAPKLHTLLEGPLGAALGGMLGALRIPPQFAMAVPAASISAPRSASSSCWWSEPSGVGAA